MGGGGKATRVIALLASYYCSIAIIAAGAERIAKQRPGGWKK